MKFFLITLLCLLSCSQVSQSHKQTMSENFKLQLENYWEQRSKLFPLDATSQGDHRYNDILPNDQTKEYRQILKDFYHSQLKEMVKINAEQLDAKEKVSYDIFKYELTMQLVGLDDLDWMIPFSQFEGLPLTMPQLGSGESIQPFNTYQDYLNWISRLKGFTLWVDSAISNFREGIKTNYVLPKSLVIKMIPQMKDMITTDPTTSLFYQPIKKMPQNFSQKQKDELTKLYQEAIKTLVVPSYQKLADFLSNEYLPKARKTSGISYLKDGDKTYRYLVKLWTTTTMSPDKIYQLGLKEVARIKNEMNKVKNQVNFKGSLLKFFDFMRNDAQFMPYKTPEEILNAFHEIQKTIEPHLNTMFSLKPKSKFEIRQTEAFRAASASAEYLQGAPDGSRPGIFYIPILDATKFNITSGMESLFLHEAIPGHHYQISIQQENESLPKFQRFSWYGAYGEGWALYTESLGKDLGLYTNPYQYMGALGDEMHRAIRLVVDVAIHTKGMTRDQAIKYMMSNEAISLEGATAEIERYMAIPGQALSYKVGSLKIWELRKKYSKILGNKFDLASFHAEFLKDGCMPLSIIEKKMDAWAKI